MSIEGKHVEGFQRVHWGQGDAWAGVSALSYALTAIFSRVASLTADPFVAPAFRLLPVLTIAWIQVSHTRQGWRPLNPAATVFIGWRVLLVLFLGGTLTTVVGTVGYFFALREGGVLLAQPVLATNILWSALIAAIFLKESLTPKMTVGMLTAVLGVALLAYGQSAGGDVQSSMLRAIPLALIPAVSWASAMNCTRYALTRSVDKYMAIAVSGTWATVALIGVVFVIGRGSALWTTGWQTIGVLLLAGLLTAAAQISLAQALSLTTVVSVTTIRGVNPVLAGILAVIFLGEDLNLLVGLGTILTVVGVIYVQLSKFQKT
jgi:drug/metabolite transporter (DMT)-like permease